MPCARRVEAFIDDCPAAWGKDLVVTEGLINTLAQCLAASFLGVKVLATICFVLLIDAPDTHRGAMEDHPINDLLLVEPA